MHQSSRSSLRLERLVPTLVSWYRASLPYIDEVEDAYMEFAELEEFIQFPNETCDYVAHDFYDPYPVINEYNNIDGAERVALGLAVLAMGSNGGFSLPQQHSHQKYIGKDHDLFLEHPFVELYKYQVRIIRELALLHVMGTIRDQGHIEEFEGMILTSDCIESEKLQDGIALRYLLNCELKRQETLGVDYEQETKHHYRIQSRRSQAFN